MKKSNLIYFSLFIFFWLALPLAQSQDTLNAEILQKFSHSFTVENGQLKGDGATFLDRETNQNQYTLIGEYHGSKAISEFTEALIPVLDQNNYKQFALEVGPIAAQKLNTWCKSSMGIQKSLYEFNSTYNYDNGEYTAIPFFSNTEDAAFLAKASKNNWNIIGLDQEFYFGFDALLDDLFKNVDSKSKSKFQSSYNLALDSVKAIIQDDIAEKRRLPEQIYASKEIQSFLDQMNEIPENKAIVEAFRKSIALYKLNNDRKWRQNNEQRALYMKMNLRKGMESAQFDISKDKIVVKMGAYHNSRGQSPMEVFDVGNTLSELAEFHGNSSLHIAFTTRFYVEEGKEYDVLESEPDDRYNVFAQMGQKDKWTIIDLREIQHGLYYYPIKYKVSEEVEDLIKRYDILIIPPLESEPTPNFARTK